MDHPKLYGCELCTEQSCCVTHGGEGLDPTDPEQLDDLQYMEQKQFEGRTATSVRLEQEDIKEAIEMSKIESKMDFEYEQEKGPFCCSGTGKDRMKHDVRASAAWIPDEKNPIIHDFVAALNADDISYKLGALTLEEMKAIKTVIKANTREDWEDVGTYLFVKSSEITDNPVKSYTCFARLDTPQRFENLGERGYVAFHCRQHKKFIRVGCHTIKWSKNAKWARWENKALDELMGHPQKAVNDFGQPPITFPGIFGL